MKKITFAALAVPLMWVLLLLLLFSNYKVYAQERMVLSGIVKSADGTPMEGVSVWQEGTDDGTQTNEQGFYTLETFTNASISYEYLGFKKQTLKISGKVLNVTLVEDADVLDEVVINAGYYSVKDKERTGSIAKITSKEIGQQPVANPLAAMQGRMAGVNITQNSGTPGGGFDIQIRGRNSLRTEGNAPLYIVDGVPYASQSMSDTSLSAAIFAGNVSPLNSINPNDIESIEVLKDADATAIYGSRGSNGVVLITTKKGNADKTTFSVQSTTSVSTVSKFMDLMSTEEYLKMRRDAFANDGISQYPANAYDVNGTWDQNRNTNWQEKFIGGKAVTQNTQFSVGGGSGKTNYLLSASHRKDGTVYLGDFGYKRTNFLLNMNHKSKNERFSLHSSIQKSTQHNNLMAISMINNILLAPNAPNLYNIEGNLNWENNTFENPIAKLNAKYFSESGDLLGNINVNYSVFNDIKLGISMGLSETILEEFKTNPHTIYNPAYGLTSANSSIINSSYTHKNWIIEPKAQWEKMFLKGRLEVLLGTTFEERKQKGMSINASSFTSNDFIMNIANAANQRTTRDTESQYRYTALYGRANYIYNEKYIVNLTGRRDGSSRFGKNNKFGNFGSIGTAWLFHKEKIFQNSYWLSLGKLRGSYGISGSDLIGDYQYLNMFGISPYKYDNEITLQPLRHYNPDFSWETNKKLEVAVELELLDRRLSFSTSYYRNRSSNQLVGIPLPSTTGFNNVQGNLEATVQNSGWEIILTSTNLNKTDFRWVTSFNITLPSNKLLEFPNLELSPYVNQYKIGEPTTAKMVYHLIGVNRTTGLYEFEDVDGDGEITVLDRKKMVNVGTTLFGGIQNHLVYKNWELDILWQFVKQKNYTMDYYGAMPGTINNGGTYMLDYYSEENLDAKYQKPSSGSNSLASNAYSLFKASDGVIDDMSFLRLKSVQLVYGIPFKKSNVKCSVYAQGTNLVTFTKYQGGDPETIGSLLPSLKSFSVGFNLEF